MVRLPIRSLWVATGNNPEFSNEMARRLVRIRLDARVDQPWRRGGFRHPNLTEWVKANRARLVAASLTLCRAWIAAGMPHGSRIIGSFESWSAVMGGVLTVAGVPGFLGNVDEMLEAADAEGAVWRAFVARWWESFRAGPVGVGDLYKVAIVSEPSIPLGDGNERSQKTRLGRALGRMRDRIFHVGPTALRIAPAGIRHQAQQWQLVHEVSAAETGERVEPNAQRSPTRSPEETEAYQGEGERGERWERPSTYEPLEEPDSYSYGNTTDKRSPPSLRSPSDCSAEDSSGERAGERDFGCSPNGDALDRSKEVL
jgi:hypothetical protein